MRKPSAPAAIDDQLNVPEGAADLIGKNNNMESVNTMKLQKPNNKRSREAAVDTSRSSSCSKQKPATNTNKTGSASRSSSKYRGVTRHRWTGRYEAHLWDKNSWNQSQSKKGRQVYLGAYDNEDTAAHAYDLAALKYWGAGTILNFPVEMYDKEMEDMQRHTREEYIASLRRKSNGFSRGVSKYRGVARHHHNGRWEARIGRVYGNKYLYLGTYSTQEEAAIAYDIAALQYRGLSAVTNFDMSNYLRCMPPGQFITSHTSSLMLKENDNTDSHNTAASTNEENHKPGSAAATPRATYDNQINSLDPPIQLDYPNPLLRFCARACSGSRIDHQGNNDFHSNMMIMQLENMLGTSNDHVNQLIQDQVSATCSAPPMQDHLQFSDGTGIGSYKMDNYSHQLMTPSKPAMMANACDPPYLNTAYHLEKLMEYNELLQSPKPKEMLEKGTLSAIVDTLSDTASSSTTCSLSSTVQMMSNDYMIKPGGYVAGLLSTQEECIKYVDQIFDISDMVPGTTDSICSSNDLSSIQELATCNISDIPCNNAIYPFHFNCVPSDHGLMLDSSLSNSLVSLLPTLNNFQQHYLQR